MVNDRKWRDYEEVALYLLNQIVHEFSLDRFEGKQKIKGKRSGTDWEIDAKGVVEGGNIFIIVECRRNMTSRQTQENIGALAYKILDTGAKGGIIVSPLDIQVGARKIANKENIYYVKLDASSTNVDYILKYLRKVIVGKTGELSFSGKLYKRVFRGLNGR